MASLYRKKNSQYWYATWRNGVHIRNRSTKIPIRGQSISGIKETPTQARARAQIIADGFEAADKDGLTAARTKNAMALLARHSSGGHTTVRQYCEHYIKSNIGILSADTISLLKRTSTLFLEDLGAKADAPISIITRADIKAFINEELKHVSESTVKNYKSALSRIFMAAYDEEIIDKTPCFQVTVPHVESPVPKVEKEAFSPAEVQKMFEILPWDWRSVVIFSIFTGGQRLGDICGLKWDQIDLEEAIIHMTTKKTKRKLRIPIIEPFKKHIESLPRIPGVPYVHPTLARFHNGRAAPHICQKFITLIVQGGIIPPPVKTERYGRRVTVKPKTFHSFRRTAATMLHSIGIDPALAQKIVGHSSGQVHMRYILPDDDQRREAFERLSGALPLPEMPDANT